MTRLAPAIRASAFVRKEIAEVLRQPRLLLTLVVGPFAILLLFGSGLREADPPFETIFVVPDDELLAEEVREFAEGERRRLSVQAITQEEAAALEDLRAGAVDMVVVFPDGVDETVREEQERAVITLHHNRLDPIEDRAILLYLQHAVDEINRQVVARAIEEGQAEGEELQDQVARTRERVQRARQATDEGDEDRAAAELGDLRADAAALALGAGPAAALAGGPAGEAARADTGEEEPRTLRSAAARFRDRVDAVDDGDDMRREGDALEEDLATMEDTLAELRELPPDVLAGPFRGEAHRIAGNDVDLGDFYAPAVVVVLLQHLLVSFVSLSLVRERELGTAELYRVAPLRVGEILAGKYLAYGALAAVVAAALVLGLVLVLGTPMHGSWGVLALVLVAVVAASCGLGLCIAAVSRTDSQAVQYTMLVLLATVFFSGFVLSLERFLEPFGLVSFLLPASYGVHLLRPVMLSGTLEQPELLAALAGFAAVLGTLGWLGLRRQLRSV